MENLEEYRCRTGKFMTDSLPGEGYFETNENLRKKVDNKSEFLPFAGDTIIFNLNNDIRNIVTEVQKDLYETCDEMMAVKLFPSTFHMTLHDLHSGIMGLELQEQMDRTKETVERIMVEKEDGWNGIISLRMIRVFNLVNTSVVIGLEPADEQSCIRIMEMYDRFQKICFLPYPLTMHITVGYYRPGKYTDGQRQKLRNLFERWKKIEGTEVILDSNKWQYVRFKDMNHYFAVCQGKEVS